MFHCLLNEINFSPWQRIDDPTDLERKNENQDLEANHESWSSFRRCRGTSRFLFFMLLSGRIRLFWRCLSLSSWGSVRVRTILGQKLLRFPECGMEHLNTELVWRDVEAKTWSFALRRWLDWTSIAFAAPRLQIDLKSKAKPQAPRWHVSWIDVRYSTTSKKWTCFFKDRDMPWSSDENSFSRAGFLTFRQIWSPPLWPSHRSSCRIPSPICWFAFEAW